MTEEGGIIALLLERNCLELLQKTFLYLDPISLHNCRQVSRSWNDFIRESVWGSQRGLRALERKLHHYWLYSEPCVFSVDYTDKMFIHQSKSALALDNKYLVVGLSHVGQGGAKVIDLATQEVVAHLAHQDAQDRGVSSVMICRSWIITQGKKKALMWNRNTFQQVFTLDLTIDQWSTLQIIETKDGRLYLALFKPFPMYPNCLSLLYKLTTDSENQKIDLIFEKQRLKSCKFGMYNDTPVLVNTKRQFAPGNVTLNIDQIHETDGRVEVKNSNIELDCDLEIIDYSFSFPYLVILFIQEKCSRGNEDDEEHYHYDVLYEFSLEVWNIERPRVLPLYSINIVKTEEPIYNNSNVTLLLENNLIRVSTPCQIYVFDATSIEDRGSVLNSMREILVNNEEVVLFNKFLGVSKRQDTIIFRNFWK